MWSYVGMYVLPTLRTCIRRYIRVLCVLFVIQTTDYYRMVMINGPVSELPFYKTDAVTLRIECKKGTYDFVAVPTFVCKCAVTNTVRPIN